MEDNPDREKRLCGSVREHWKGSKDCSSNCLRVEGGMQNWTRNPGHWHGIPRSLDLKEQEPLKQFSNE